MTIFTLSSTSAFPVYVVSGPSGSGKTSLCAQAFRDIPWIRPSISHTTRPPRSGETEGKDYFFVDRPRFERMIRQGDFLEWADVHGQLYGTAAVNLEMHTNEHSLLFEVDCKGATQIRKKLPQSVLIFVMTPSFEDLIARIRNRGAVSSEELSIRVRTAREEIRQIPVFDYVVVNDRFSDASLRFVSILRAARCVRDLVLPGQMARWMEEIDVYKLFPR
jgi:guanylate kinase